MSPDGFIFLNVCVLFPLNESFKHLLKRVHVMYFQISQHLFACWVLQWWNYSYVQRKNCHDWSGALRVTQTLQVCTVFAVFWMHKCTVFSSQCWSWCIHLFYLPLYSCFLPLVNYYTFLHLMFIFARQSVLLIVMTYCMHLCTIFTFWPFKCCWGN